MKVSAFVIMSEPEKLCYPYIESVKSFLPLCDEIIVVYNCLSSFQDGSLPRIAAIDPKVKVIAGIFDYERFGWASQGIMRTNGYYAATGDIVLMFDADGIVHEQDYDLFRDQLSKFYDSDYVYAFWQKKRFNKTDTWVPQHKHSGVYNKNKLGNHFNFYGGKQLGVPNWEAIPEAQRRAQQLSATIYGYERIWDTRDIFDHKLAMRRVMMKSGGYDVQPEEDFIKEFIKERQEKLDKEGQIMPIEAQPAIIQDKLKSVTPDMFGYNLWRQK